MGGSVSSIDRVSEFLEASKTQGETVCQHMGIQLNRTDLEILVIAAKGSHIHETLLAVDQVIDRWQQMNKNQKNSISRLQGMIEAAKRALRNPSQDSYKQRCQDALMALGVVGGQG